MNEGTKIAVINANDDIVEAIQLALTTNGFTTVGAHLIDFKRGTKDIFEFIETEKPDAIVIDIAPPYEENWKYFRLIQSNPKAKDVPFVVTTTNLHLFQKIIGEEGAGAIEIMGKPFDLETIVKKVQSALKKK